VTASSRAGRLALVAGAIIALGAAILGPRPVVPLYDGVVPVEPYRWLDPPSGAAGDPTSASATAAIVNGGNELIALATDEVTPQAQIFASPGSLVLPPGTRSLNVSIAPVRATTQPADGAIAGNVYRILVTNQSGTLVTAPDSAKVSIVLRSPDPATTEGVIEAFDGTRWHTISDSGSTLAGSFVGVVTSFGDFAVVLPGQVPPSSSATPVPTPTSVAASPSEATEGPGASVAAGPSPVQTVLRIGAPIAALVLVALVAVIGLRQGGRGRRSGRR